jgi:hypothetical protein
MFESEPERLAWLIGKVERRSRDLKIPKVESGDVNLLLVTTSMVESALQYTKAILSLIENSLFLAAGPTERALWEIWNDFRYLLRTPEPQSQALKVLINASLEVSDFVAKHLPAASPSAEAGLERTLASYQTQDPKLFAEVRAQRQKRRFHWSGKSASAIAREVSFETSLYKVLSWDTHTVLAPIRDIQVQRTRRGFTIVFSRREDVFANQDRLAWAAGGVLFNMWNEYASRWKIDMISLPKAAGPEA